MGSVGWVAELALDAPDVVACWRVIDGSMNDRAQLVALRRELRARVNHGDAPRILEQQEAVGDALGTVLGALPDDLLRAPGGEEDWNVAHAFVHHYTALAGS